MPTRTLLTPPAPDSPDRVYPPAERRVSRRERFFQRISQPGFTLALFMLWVALSPSLLPQTWWMHAIAVGMSVFLGYVVGTLVGRLAVWVARRIGLEIRVAARAGWGIRWGWDLLLVPAGAGASDRAREVRQPRLTPAVGNPGP